MRKKIVRTSAPLKQVQNAPPQSSGYVLPRSHPSGGGSDLRETKTENQRGDIPGGLETKQSREKASLIQREHFVQEKHVKRQWPDTLQRSALDEETFTLATQQGLEHKEIAPWEQKLVSRYALRFDVTAEEALAVLIENRGNLRYIADEVDFQLPSFGAITRKVLKHTL